MTTSYAVVWHNGFSEHGTAVVEETPYDTLDEAHQDHWRSNPDAPASCSELIKITTSEGGAFGAVIARTTR